MIDGPKISIIVPIFNIVLYIEKCINSIINQTYINLQIILVDDGSTDGSSQICDKYQQKDSRIFVIHKKNEGLVRARKTGLFYAEGDYVCYIDGDDWIEIDMIECLAAKMFKMGIDMVVSNYFIETTGRSQLVKNKLDSGIYNTENIISTMLYAGVFYEFGISQFVWAKLFRKNLLQSIQEQVDDKIRCGEDVALVYPYILQTEKIYISEYAGYHYLQRSDSMTSCYSLDELFQVQLVIRHLHTFFKQSVYSGVLYKQLNQYAKNLLLIRYISFFDSWQTEKILMPFGGITLDSKIIIYGAGKLGQSIYYYLSNSLKNVVVDWLDKNNMIYQKSGQLFQSPERLKSLEGKEYDAIVIAIINQTISTDIFNYLEDIGVERKKIKQLTWDFVREDYLIIDELS